MELGVSFRIAWQHGGFGFMDVGQAFWGALLDACMGSPFPSLPFPSQPFVQPWWVCRLLSSFSCLGSAFLVLIEERGFPYPGG